MSPTTSEDDEPPEDQVQEEPSAAPPSGWAGSTWGAAPTPAPAPPPRPPPVPTPPLPEQMRPDALAPGEREVLDSGAEIHFLGGLGRYGVYDAGGKLHGYRRELK